MEIFMTEVKTDLDEVLYTPIYYHLGYVTPQFNIECGERISVYLDVKTGKMMLQKD